MAFSSVGAVAAPLSLSSSEPPSLVESASMLGSSIAGWMLAVVSFGSDGMGYAATRLEPTAWRSTFVPVLSTHARVFRSRLAIMPGEGDAPLARSVSVEPTVRSRPLSFGSRTVTKRSPLLEMPKTWMGGSGAAAPAVAAAVEVGAADPGVSSVTSCAPSADHSHSSSPVPRWKAATADCQQTRTMPPATIASGGTASAAVATRATCASHVRPPSMLHIRTKAPVGPTETESSDFPCGWRSAIDSAGPRTLRHATPPVRRSMPATTPGSVATNARRCWPAEWKSARRTRPTCWRYQSTRPAWSSYSPVVRVKNSANKRSTA